MESLLKNSKYLKGFYDVGYNCIYKVVNIYNIIVSLSKSRIY